MAAEDSSSKSKTTTTTTTTTNAKSTKPPVPVDPIVAIQQTITADAALLTRGASELEPRLTLRAVRSLSFVRRRLKSFGKNAPKVLLSTIELVKSTAAPIQANGFLAEARLNTPEMQQRIAKSPLEDVSKTTATTEPATATPTADTDVSMDTTLDDSSSSSTTSQPTSTNNPTDANTTLIVPEVFVYIDLLYALFCLDIGAVDEAAQICEALATQLTVWNRRTADSLSARVYSTYALAIERWGAVSKTGTTPQNSVPIQPHPLGTKAFSSIRANLLAAYRTSCLQHNEPAQAALSVAILRNYLSEQLYSQADTFRLKSTFPEARASSSLHARYLYYTGRILSVQLHYSDAHSALQNALRKAPQGRTHAIAFRSLATKLFILVELLMGDIPERSIFSSPSELAPLLYPYLQLTRSVRVGDLTAFERVQQEYGTLFERDGLTSLIQRVRQHVIKAALRQINVAYSKISLNAVASKLAVNSAEEAESVVVKAIADAVLDARVNSSEGTLITQTSVDVYSTSAPQDQLDKRIRFCMDIHNGAVQALRFPSELRHSTDLLDEDDDDDELAMARKKKKKDSEKKKEDATKGDEKNKDKDGKNKSEKK